MRIENHLRGSANADAARGRWVNIERVQLFSVGHSTHPLEDLIGLLTTHEIQQLADIRTVPRSRRWPHFRSDRLAASLPTHGIGYAHIAALSGWRRPLEDTPNGGWRNRSLRGYADYALTDGFADGLRELCDLAASRRTAMMCSEALWWRCHRRLVADRLVAAGWDVRHIGPDGRTTLHALPGFAVVTTGGRVIYPP